MIQLPSIPNPVSLESLGARSSEAGEHRNVHCARYEGCMNEAVHKNWSGFSCRKCPLQKLSEGARVEDFLVRSDGGEAVLPSHK